MANLNNQLNPHEIKNLITSIAPELINKVHVKGYHNKPFTDEQKKSNNQKSKIRARVEYIFGFMEQSMKRLKLKSVGIKRATGIIGLINLTYNLFRYEQVMRLKLISIKYLLNSIDR